MRNVTLLFFTLLLSGCNALFVSKSHERDLLVSIANEDGSSTEVRVSFPSHLLEEINIPDLGDKLSVTSGVGVVLVLDDKIEDVSGSVFILINNGMVQKEMSSNGLRVSSSLSSFIAPVSLESLSDSRIRREGQSFFRVYLQDLRDGGILAKSADVFQFNLKEKMESNRVVEREKVNLHNLNRSMIAVNKAFGYYPFGLILSLEVKGETAVFKINAKNLKSSAIDLPFRKYIDTTDALALKRRGIPRNAVFVDVTTSIPMKNGGSLGGLFYAYNEKIVDSAAEVGIRVLRGDIVNLNYELKHFVTYDASSDRLISLIDFIESLESSHGKCDVFICPSIRLGGDLLDGLYVEYKK